MKSPFEKKMTQSFKVNVKKLILDCVGKSHGSISADIYNHDKAQQNGVHIAWDMPYCSDMAYFT